MPPTAPPRRPEGDASTEARRLALIVPVAAERKRGGELGASPTRHVETPRAALAAEPGGTRMVGHATEPHEAGHGDRRIALLISALAFCLALSSTAGNNAQTEAISRNIEASDL